MTVERSECSPINIVSDVASLMRGRAKEKGLSIGIEPVYPIPETICSSALRLRQILLNLVGNAIKFTERGLVRIILRCELESSRGPRMVFEVADTGIGINDGQLREIFQPFLQVDSSMRRQYGGTGLGLAISQRLARLLGGDISVQSKRGQGSRFSVEVDTGLLYDVRMIGSGEEVAPDPKPDPNELALPKKLSGRVLLAEDGLDNQKLIMLQLKAAGLDVTIAENGSVAYDKAMDAWSAEQPFDVILMDMQMPVLDGYGATAMLREAGYKGTIIALTAHAMPDDRTQCVQAGCDDYATKPIARGALLKLIATCLRSSDDSAS